MHWRWGAKQAMAHTLISMPVWNCLFRISQTPWTGVAIALFYNEKGFRVTSEKHSWSFELRRHLFCSFPEDENLTLEVSPSSKLPSTIDTLHRWVEG